MNTIKISTIKVLFIFLAFSMLNNTGFATSGTIATYWSSSQKGSMNFSTFSNFTNGVANAYQQFFSAVRQARRQILALVTLDVYVPLGFFNFFCQKPVAMISLD